MQDSAKRQSFEVFHMMDDDYESGYDWWEASRDEWERDRFANITINGVPVLDWLLTQPDDDSHDAQEEINTGEVKL